MVLDIIVLSALAIALYKGISKGLVVGVFSFLALLIGIAAALKFSAIAGQYMSVKLQISGKWVSVLSFLAVFAIAVALVRLGAKLIETSLEMAMLGWVNKLGGIIFYVLLYMLMVSVAIFYAEKTGFVKPEAFASSSTYAYVEPWGPAIIDLLGMVIPWFKGMFDDLGKLFEGLAQKVPPAQP